MNRGDDSMAKLDDSAANKTMLDELDVDENGRDEDSTSDGESSEVMDGFAQS